MSQLDDLLDLGSDVDAFHGRFISKVWGGSSAVGFQIELEAIRREYDRILGYRRGFKEACTGKEADSQASAEEPLFVTKALAELRVDLEKLARRCTAAAGHGRPPKDGIYGADREIALRAKTLHAANRTTKLRGAIVQAIREREEAGLSLAITTTLEGHIRRIRRGIASGLLPD